MVADCTLNGLARAGDSGRGASGWLGVSRVARGHGLQAQSSGARSSWQS